MLQLCVALKIVVANRLVWHHLKVESLIKSDRCSYYTGYRTIPDAIRYNPDHYSFKIFPRLWLAPFPWLILHNQLALAIRTSWKKRAIYQRLDGITWLETRLIDGIFDWKRVYMSNSQDHRPKWRSLLSEDEIDEFLTKTERKKCKSTQNVLLDEWDQRFWEVSARYTIISSFISWGAPRSGPKFSTNVASLRGGKLVKNF